MQCPRCARSMRLLFTSYACDHCDGVVEPRVEGRGFILFHPDQFHPGQEAYVFRSRSHAHKYRKGRRLAGWEIREVGCACEFVWRPAQGIDGNIELADHRYEIFADHRFEPGPYRAFLIGSDMEAATG